MPTEFQPEDVERMRELLQFHPQGESLFSSLSEAMVVQDLARGFKYPINSFTDLLAQLGRGRELKFGEDTIKAEDLRAKIPAFYFPISSQDDCMHKAAELMKNRIQSRVITTGEPVLPEGHLMPANMAPPLAPETMRLRAKVPARMPAGAGIGYTKEEVDKLLTEGGPT